MSKARNLLSKEDQNAVVLAIQGAEKNTSGEIRVHLEDTCREDVLDRASYLFKRMKMHETELRNGVLIYLAIKNRKFAILGDTGINQLVSDDYWNHIKEAMEKLFMEERYAMGLVTGIRMAGEQLQEHFPYQSDDVNELSDDISFGN